MRLIRLLADPRRRALPLDVGRAVPEVDRAGLAVQPSRPQSHILKVKMYGVALISSTIELRPEQCTVPAGIRK